VPNIKNEELAFLKELTTRDLIFDPVDADDINLLRHIVEALEERRERDRNRTAAFVAGKRKTNPLYGRSKEEIIKRKQKGGSYGV